MQISTLSNKLHFGIGLGKKEDDGAKKAIKPEPEAPSPRIKTIDQKMVSGDKISEMYKASVLPRTYKLLMDCNIVNGTPVLSEKKVSNLDADKEDFIKAIEAVPTKAKVSDDKNGHKNGHILAVNNKVLGQIATKTDALGRPISLASYEPYGTLFNPKGTMLYQKKFIYNPDNTEVQTKDRFGNTVDIMRFNANGSIEHEEINPATGKIEARHKKLSEEEARLAEEVRLAEAKLAEEVKLAEAKLAEARRAVVNARLAAGIAAKDEATSNSNDDCNSSTPCDAPICPSEVDDLWGKGTD